MDAENFSSTVTESITSDKSREALSREIADQVLEDKPLIKRIAGERLAGLISFALDSDLSNSTIESTANQAVIYMTSTSREEVTLDLRGIKRVVAVASTVLDLLESTQVIEEDFIPDEIVLIEANSIPSLSKVADINSLLIFVYLALLLFVGVLLYFWLNLSKLDIAKFYGTALIVSSVIGFLISNLTKSSVLVRVKSANMRVVIGDLYSIFVSQLQTQLIVAGILGIVLVVSSIGWKKYVINRSA